MTNGKLALRFLLSALLVTGAVLCTWEPLAAALMPALGAAIEWVDPHHHIAALSIEHVGSDTVLRMEAGIRRMVVMGGHVTPADPRARAVITTPTMAFLVAPTCALIVALALPANSWREVLARMALVAALCLPLLAIDAPLVLDAHLWGLHRDAHAPDTTPPILLWSGFLKGGGRFVIGIVTGLLGSALMRSQVHAANGNKGSADSPR